MKTAKLHYTEPLIREAVGAYFLRHFGRGFFIALGVISFCLIGLFVLGDRSWATGALAGMVALLVAILVVLYRFQLKRSLGMVRRMQVPEALLTCEDDRLTMASDLGSSTLPWSSIAQVWRFPRFWLLLFEGSGFVTLPLADIDPEIQAIITRKTEHAKQIGK